MNNIYNVAIIIIVCFLTIRSIAHNDYNSCPTILQAINSSEIYKCVGGYEKND